MQGIIEKQQTRVKRGRKLRPLHLVNTAWMGGCAPLCWVGMHTLLFLSSVDTLLIVQASSRSNYASI